MKILKLANYKIQPAVAEVYKNKHDQLFYNLKHGTNGNRYFWKWCSYLDNRHFKPETDSDTIELTGNDYVLRPLIINDDVKKDNKGNVEYIISRDIDTSHHNEIILLWELTNKHYTDVRYKIFGDVRVIGKGEIGKHRGDFKYKSPAPILEITGDCAFSWTGVKDDVLYGQTITYKSIENNWDIEPIIKII